MIIICPHCGTTVRPGGDGTCPACRKRVTQSEEIATERVEANTWESPAPIRASRPGSGASLPPTAGPIELNSRRRGLVGIVAGSLLCLVLGAQAISGQGNFLVYGFLAFFAFMLLTQIRMFLFPPRLAVRAGWVEVRGFGAFRVPATDVANLRLINRHPLLLLKDTAAVEPAAQRDALARSAATRGIHYALPKGSFDAEQINQMRRALALPPLVDETPAPDAVFESLLETLTPRVVVTPLLVVVNVVIFVLLWQVDTQDPNRDAMITWGANYGPKTLSGEWWRLLTSMFLHFSVMHLGFNMWVLWDVGRMVERLLGNTAFLIVYMTSGFFGSVASVMWRQDVVSAGASGAVFGVFGVLLGFLIPRRDSIPMEVIREHRSSVTAFLILNLLLGLSIPWIDMAAHGGGLLAGFVCGLLLTQKLSPDRRAARRLRTAMVGLIAIAASVATGYYLPLHFSANAGGQTPLAFQDVISPFASVEATVVDRFNETTRKLQQGELDSQEAADIVEKEVLAPWSEAIDDVRASVPRLLGDERARIGRLLEYGQLRQQSWELLVQAWREDSEEKFSDYLEKSREADEVIRGPSR